MWSHPVLPPTLAGTQMWSHPVLPPTLAGTQVWSNPVLPPSLAGTQMWSHSLSYLLNNWTYPPPPHVPHPLDVPLL